MTESEKINLIIESIIYCKKVRDLGMPKPCYSKALREPIFFLWEKNRNKNKYDSSKFRSYSAKDIPNNSGNLIYDHVMPFNYVLEKLLAINPLDLESVRECLMTNLIACTITKEENNLLSKNGFSHKMPDDWDGVDPMYRYKKVKIDFYEQNKK